MQYLGGMIAGNPGKAYDESRLGSQKVATGDADAAGDAAFGRALTALYGGGSQAPPTVPPGQPSMPTQPTGGMPYGGGAPSMGQPPMGPPPGPGMYGPPPGPNDPTMSIRPMPGGPQMAGGAMPPQPGMPPPGGGGPPMGGPLPQPGMPPMGGGPPGMPQGQPNFGQPGGGITWQAAVMAVVKANPGIDQNPRTLARAVDRFMPIMNQQSLAAWREMQMQSKQQMEEGRNYRFGESEAGRNWRAQLSSDTRVGLANLSREARMEVEQFKAENRTNIAELSAQTRKEIAGMNDTTRRELFGEAEEGRNRRADQAESGRQSRFETREQRLQSKADFDREFKTKSLDLATQRFANTKDKQSRDAAYREAKTQLDAQRDELRARISGVAAGALPAGATKEDQKKGTIASPSVAELERSYREAVKKLDSIFMGTRTNRDMKTETGIPVPPEHQNKPDGDKFEVDGKPYVKRGGMLVPQ